jgi:hypothetical protein
MECFMDRKWVEGGVCDNFKFCFVVMLVYMCVYCYYWQSLVCFY